MALNIIAEVLDRAIRAAGIPIEGVSVPVAHDRTAWRVEFRPEATVLQRTQAAQIVASIDIGSAALAQAEVNLRMDRDKLFKAVVVWIAQKVNLTPQQARTEILAIYQNL